MRTPVALAALGVCLLASAPSASEFEDFRIPASSWRSQVVSAGGSLRRGSTDQTGSYLRSFIGNGSMSARFSMGRDSDRRQWEVELSGSLTGFRDRLTSGRYQAIPSTGVPDYTSAEDERRLRSRLNEYFSVGAAGRWYPDSRPFGFEARGSAGIDDYQQWFAEDRNSVSLYLGSWSDARSSASSESWSYSEFAEAAFVPGWGRVRDATSVFSAWLLEERLLRDGALTRSLSPSGLQKLAQLLSVRDGFARVHVQPEKFFWEEVERVLREDGALAGEALGAAATMHADEALVVARWGFPRATGWFVGPEISARHRHGRLRTDQTLSSRFDDRVNPPSLTQSRSGSSGGSFSEAILLGALARVHRPLGRRTQARVESEALFEVAGDDQLFVVNLASLQHLVGERWFGEAFLSHSRSIVEAGLTEASWTVSTGVSLSYFLEDFCKASLLLSRNEQTVDPFPAPGMRRRQLDLVLQLAISIARGRFDAPGLIGPVRPLN